MSDPVKHQEIFLKDQQFWARTMVETPLGEQQTLIKEAMGSSDLEVVPLSFPALHDFVGRTWIAYKDTKLFVFVELDYFPLPNAFLYPHPDIAFEGEPAVYTIAFFNELTVEKDKAVHCKATHQKAMRLPNDLVKLNVEGQKMMLSIPIQDNRSGVRNPSIFYTENYNCYQFPMIPNILESGRVCTGYDNRWQSSREPDPSLFDHCIAFLDHFKTAPCNHHMMDTMTRKQFLQWDKEGISINTGLSTHRVCTDRSNEVVDAFMKQYPRIKEL